MMRAFGIAVILVALSWAAGCDLEAAEASEADRQDAVAAERRRLDEETNAKNQAKALARYLAEQHLLDDANRMMYPVGQARLAARNQ